MASNQLEQSIEQTSSSDVMNELFDACRDGNLTTVMQLVKNKEKLNLFAVQKNGDTVLHVAASNGNVEMLQYLQLQGFDVEARNSSGDTPWHAAAKYGHWPVIMYFITQNVDLNAQNENGETVLHYAVRYGHQHMVQALILQQVDINIQDMRGWTPLHVACQQKQSDLALLLLQLGCKANIPDSAGETPLHIACRENLLYVVQTMCSYGCDVETENRAGMTPLLLASRFGCAELVRCLLLSGADMTATTEDGIKAADIALANGRTEIAELLNKLGATITRDRRDAYVQQLMPTSKPLDCVRVNVLGSSGVGKTQLIESLKCGLMRSLFRRGSALLSAVTGNGWGADEDETDGANEAVRLQRPRDSRSSKNRKTEVISNRRISENQVPGNLNYTRGIKMEQGNITGAGDLCFWEYSGYESYYAAYDTNLIGDPNAVYIVVVSLQDSLSERHQQFDFWLNFIRCRTSPVEPIGFGGCKLWAPRVLLVATRADIREKTGSDDIENDNMLVNKLMQRFETDLIIEPHLFAVDCNEPMNFEMKTLRRAIGVVKRFICEYLPTEVGLLQPVVSILPDWCRVLATFPVVTWTSFVEYIRSRINPLATDDHLRELVNQLAVTGEIIDIQSAEGELIILDTEWFGTHVIGCLLAYDTILRVQPTGRLSFSDLHSIFPRVQSSDIIRLLSYLDLAILCTTSTNGINRNEVLSAATKPGPTADVVMPCLDRSEGPQDQSLTSSPTSADGSTADNQTVIGGFQMQADVSNQLIHIFPRIVNAVLHRLLLSHASESSDNNGVSVNDVNSDEEKNDHHSASCDHRIVQWSRGIKVVRDEVLNAVLRLSDDGLTMTLICTGPKDKRRDLFFFQETLCNFVYLAVEKSCPSMHLERCPLSVRHLRSSITPPHAYRARDVLLSQLAGTTCVQAATVDQPEQLIDLIAYGDENLFSHLRPGFDQSVLDMPIYTRYRLAALLDPIHPKGNDVMALAQALGQPPPNRRTATKKNDGVDSDSDDQEDDELSPTDSVLRSWSLESTSGKHAETNQSPTIRELHAKLANLERPDVVEVLLSLTPLYCYQSRD